MTAAAPKRGRPPLARGEVSVNVSFRLPSGQYDRTQEQATAARVSLADWLRRAVKAAGRPVKVGDK